jgi:uncharacterized membrane protein
MANAVDLLTKNDASYGAETLKQTDLGVYCPYKDTTKGPADVPSDRFRTTIGLCPGDTRDPKYASANAVRVQTAVDAPTFLSRVMRPDTASLRIKASATAARVDEAGFKAGTGLVAVDTQQSALLNGILGGLLGTQLQLSAVQYEGLLNTDLQALSFLNALATQVHLSAGTYNQLLASNVQVGQVVQAMVNVLQQQGQLTSVGVNALNGLVALQSKITGNPTLKLGDLIDLGLWQNEPIGGSAGPTALQAGLNIYQLLSLTLQVADGRHAVAIPNFNFSILGLAAQVSLEASVVEPPQSPPFAFGPVGLSVHTAQVRLKLRVQLLTGLLAALLGPVVQLPLYVEAGAGDATLTNINCQPRTDKMSNIVTVQANSGVVRVYLGEVTTDVMNNVSQPVNFNTQVQPSPILGLNVLSIISVASVTAKAQVDIGKGSGDLKYTYDDINNRVIKTVSSGKIVGSLLDSLKTLNFNACVVGLLGICVIPLSGQDLVKLLGAVHAILDPIVDNLLDPLIDGLLVALGIKLGSIDVTVTGVRCGVPVLIQ